MDFIKHRHPLILNEKYHGDKGDVCYICKEVMLSPLIHSVYTCSGSSISDSTSSDANDVVVKTYSAMGKPYMGLPYPELPLKIEMNDVDCPKLLIHRSCAELPLIITNHPMHQHHTIVLNHELGNKCSMCDEVTRGEVRYNCRDCLNFRLCIKCVASPRVHHPGHNQHELTVVQHPASFRCYACQDDKQSASASCKCNLCPFWIHMKCALLPSLLKCEFHRHPLLLSYSLSELYLRFRHYCSICHAILSPTQWLYHCANCRFLAHVNCVTSTEDLFKSLSTFGDQSSSLLHLPARDESSLNFSQQLSIKIRINDDKDKGYDNSYFFYDDSYLSFSSDIADTWYDHSFFNPAKYSMAAAPGKEKIYHWSHEQHPLTLKNKCHAPDITDFITRNDDIIIVICDGCTKPIFPREEFYECHPCKYFLHKSCTEIPKQIKSRRHGDHLILSDISPCFFFICNGCKFPCSGMRMMSENGEVQLDIPCASLPRKIKHEAHHHPLTRAYHSHKECTACHRDTEVNEIIFCCDKCDFYLHGRCALKPHKIKHPWDPHPLAVTMNFDKIEDHPQDFSCEYCSQVIDPTGWFYHCSDCDISLHLFCIDLFYRHSRIKFGTSSIKIDQQVHEHGLTLVLNKRKHCCGKCGVQLYNPPLYAAPALECKPCNLLICMSCFDPRYRYESL